MIRFSGNGLTNQKGRCHSSQMRLRNSTFRAAAAPTVLVAALALLTAACGGGSSSSSSKGPATSTGTEAPTTVRLGYFPNVTHATAIVGVESGIFKTALGPNTLQTQTFNAGPAAVEALF